MARADQGRYNDEQAGKFLMRCNEVQSEYGVVSGVSRAGAKHTAWKLHARGRTNNARSIGKGRSADNGRNRRYTCIRSHTFH